MPGPEMGNFYPEFGQKSCTSCSRNSTKGYFGNFAQWQDTIYKQS